MRVGAVPMANPDADPDPDEQPAPPSPPPPTDYRDPRHDDEIHRQILAFSIDHQSVSTATTQ